MRERIIRVLNLRNQPSPEFTSFDLNTLLEASELTLHPSTSNYFATCIPTKNIGPGYYDLIPPDEIINESKKYVPGVYLHPRGFIHFGITGSGDAVTLDVTSGAVYVFSHEDEFPNDLSREALIELAEEKYPSLDLFYDQWEQKLRSDDRDASL